jgi:thiol-disulfide isomerase/thioredoxin
MQSTGPPPKKKLSVREVLAWVGVLILSVLIAQAMTAPHSHGLVVGQEVSSLKLKDRAGEVIDLAAQNGRIVVLNVYATWCPPCRAEIPDLSRFARSQTKERKGVDLYGVVFESGSPDEALRVSRDLGIDYAIMMGNQTLVETFELHTYPTTIVINRQGVVTHHHEGIVSQEQLERMVSEAETAL